MGIEKTGTTETVKTAKSVSIRLFHLGISIIILLVFWALPIDLSFEGRMVFGILVAAVYLWVTEPIPLAVTGIVAMVSLPAFGILDYTAVWAGWISSAIFFVLSSFALTKALIKSKIPLKLAFFFVKLSKGKSSLIVLAFMLTTASVSMFVSNIPATAAFAAMAASTILAKEKAEPGASRLGRCIMISIPFASQMGGLITPPGNAMNIMALGMLESFSGIQITFLQWMLMMLPCMIIILPLSWLSLIFICRPEPIKESTAIQISEDCERLGRLDAFDKKTIGVLVLLIVLWVSGPWTGLDTTAACLIGMVIMFLPGIDILNWREYVDAVSWEILLIIGAVSSVTTGVAKVGAVQWIVTKITSVVTLTFTNLLIGTAVFFPLLRLLIPVGPAALALVMMPLLGLSAEVGMSLALMTMVIAMCIGGYLSALDASELMSYRYGYYSIVQYFVTGLVPTILTFIISVTLLPILVAAVGL